MSGGARATPAPSFAAALVAAVLGACATQESTLAPAARERPVREAPAHETARTAASLLGRPSRDALGAFGPATVVRFDSGYEIWVYRFAEPGTRPPPDGRPRADTAQGRIVPEPPTAELVLLVAPSGVVVKARVRAAAEAARAPGLSSAGYARSACLRRARAVVHARAAPGVYGTPYVAVATEPGAQRDGS